MLDQSLDEIAERTPGFRGAAIMASDGLPLMHRVVPDGPDLELFAAECSALLKSLSSLTSQEQCGPLNGLSSSGDRWRMLLERINEDYFLLLVVAPDGSLGECRYRLRRAALDLEAELS